MNRIKGDCLTASYYKTGTLRIPYSALYETGVFRVETGAPPESVRAAKLRYAASVDDDGVLELRFWTGDEGGRAVAEGCYGYKHLSLGSRRLLPRTRETRYYSISVQGQSLLFAPLLDGALPAPAEEEQSPYSFDEEAGVLSVNGRPILKSVEPEEDDPELRELVLMDIEEEAATLAANANQALMGPVVGAGRLTGAEIDEMLGATNPDDIEDGVEDPVFERVDAEYTRLQEKLVGALNETAKFECFVGCQLEPYWGNSPRYGSAFSLFLSNGNNATEAQLDVSWSDLVEIEGHIRSTLGPRCGRTHFVAGDRNWMTEVGFLVEIVRGE